MSKSYKPMYRLEARSNRRNGWELFTWHVNDNIAKMGKPTPDNIARFLHSMEKSYELGGVNEHVSKALGYLPFYIEARIINQFTGVETARWQAPAFQIF